MPGLSRRKEFDLRAGRLESEMRVSELTKAGKDTRIFMCSQCQILYSDKSRHCPRCDKRRMGEVRSIPKQHIDEAREKAIRRLRSKYA